MLFLKTGKAVCALYSSALTKAMITTRFMCFLIILFIDLVGCNDAFVEVGMPRSPSHSANTSDLKQMMSSSKQACSKRQTVELLQGTKNSHLQ